MDSTPPNQPDVPIANHYLHATIRGAVNQGWKAEELLRQAQIPSTLLTDTSQSLNEKQMARLIKAVWRCSGDEALGMAQQPIPLGTFALMAELVTYSETLGGMLKQACRFYNTLRQDIQMSLNVDEGVADLTLHLLDAQLDTDHLLQEFFLLMLQRFSSWLVGSRVAPLETRFSYPPPAHIEEYRLMFGDSLRFNRPNCGYRLNAKLLKLPILRTQQELKGFLQRSPEVILRRPKPGDTLKHQIQQLLIQFDPAELPTLEAIAEQLHLTARTLRRRLADEGVLYRHLKDRIRRDIAIRLLTQENMSIAQISHLTGFTEPAAFCRAFKKWTGTQPSRYRSSHAVKTQNPD